MEVKCYKKLLQSEKKKKGTWDKKPLSDPVTLLLSISRGDSCACTPRNMNKNANIVHNSKTLEKSKHLTVKTNKL